MVAGLRALPGARLREAAGAPDAQGFFPLQWAALNNEAEVAELLLANGADVGVRDGTGQPNPNTPRDWTRDGTTQPNAHTGRATEHPSRKNATIPTAR